MSKSQPYILGIIVAGAAVAGSALLHWSCASPLAFFLYLALAVLTAGFKLRLHGIEGTYSIGFIFVLIGISRFSLGEVVAGGCAAALVQSLFNAKRRATATQVLFNIANIALSAGACFLAHDLLSASGLRLYRPAEFALLACIFWIVNTVVVSVVISLLKPAPIDQVCQGWYSWPFPYYLIGVVIVAVLPARGEGLNPAAWLFIVPLLYLVHFFYGLSRSKPAAEAAESPERLPRPARLFIGGVVATAAVLLVRAAGEFRMSNPLEFSVYLLIAAFAATCKVRLPGMMGTISLSFVLLLIAISELSLAKALLIAIVVAVVQCLWKPQYPPKVAQVLFSTAALVCSTALAYACAWLISDAGGLPAMVVVATAVLYGTNTALVSLVLCLVQAEPVSAVWNRCYFWSFPFYLVGAAAAAAVIAGSRATNSLAALFVLPLMALTYVSYRLHVAGRAQ